MVTIEWHHVCIHHRLGIRTIRILGHIGGAGPKTAVITSLQLFFLSCWLPNRLLDYQINMILSRAPTMVGLPLGRLEWSYCCCYLLGRWICWSFLIHKGSMAWWLANEIWSTHGVCGWVITIYTWEEDKQTFYEVPMLLVVIFWWVFLCPYHKLSQESGEWPK